MLIRITNKCNMLCRHCMIDGVAPDGEHMDLDTFVQALEFARRCGSVAVLISGGEPTLHPHVLDMIGNAMSMKFWVVLLSNGTFLEDKSLTKELEGIVKGAEMYRGVHFSVQITNDPRYYPRRIPEIKRDFFYVETNLRGIRACKRTKSAGIPSTMRAPSCFNLRSVTKAYGFPQAIAVLESRYHRFCNPSINVDGSVRAGEPDTCYQLGTVYSSPDDIHTALKDMQCDECGMIENLTGRELSAL